MTLCLQGKRRLLITINHHPRCHHRPHSSPPAHLFDGSGEGGWEGEGEGRVDVAYERGGVDSNCED